MTAPKHLVFFDGECGSVIGNGSGYSHAMNKNNSTSLRYKESKPKVLPQFRFPPELDSIVYVRHSATGAKRLFIQMPLVKYLRSSGCDGRGCGLHG